AVLVLGTIVPLGACSDSSYLSPNGQDADHDVSGTRSLRAAQTEESQKNVADGSTHLELWLPKGVSRNNAALVSAAHLSRKNTSTFFPACQLRQRSWSATLRGT